MDRCAWWYWAVALFCSSCADRAAPPLALEIDARASAVEAKTVIAAAQAWNARVGKTLFYVADESNEGGCDRVVIRFIDEMPSEYDEYSGLFQQIGCHYEVSILHDYGDDRENAIHELGHTLELEHSKDKDSVMFWSTHGHSVITDEDVMRVQMRWAL